MVRQFLRLALPALLALLALCLVVGCGAVPQSGKGASTPGSAQVVTPTPTRSSALNNCSPEVPISVAEIELDTGMQNLYHPGNGGIKPYDCLLSQRYGVGVDIICVPAHSSDPEVKKYYDQQASVWAQQRKKPDVLKTDFVGLPPTQSVLSINSYSDGNLVGYAAILKSASFCSIAIQLDDTSAAARQSIIHAVEKLAHRIEPRMA